jgi:Tol biopolymer transport system component
VTNDGNSRYPSWTPDGSNLMFSRRSVGGENAFLMSADAGREAPPTQLTQVPIYSGAGGWIGNDLVFGQVSPNTGSDIWIVTRGQPATARPLIVRNGTQYARPSPDGRWLAIVSDETGIFGVSHNALYARSSHQDFVRRRRGAGVGEVERRVVLPNQRRSLRGASVSQRGGSWAATVDGCQKLSSGRPRIRAVRRLP